MKIAFHPILKSNTPDSHKTHWDITEEEIIARVREAWLQGVAVDYVGEDEDAYDTSKPLVISIPPAAFYSPMVKLEEGDKGIWDYAVRYGEEIPRKQESVVRPGAEKLPAGKVEVVLYSHALLAEKKENTDLDADWEIISINASADGCPIDPITLLKNHLGLDGGTDHKLTDAEVMAQLLISIPFHDCHAQLAPAPQKEA
jgi:hypothetical protein